MNKKPTTNNKTVWMDFKSYAAIAAVVMDDLCLTYGEILEEYLDQQHLDPTSDDRKMQEKVLNALCECKLIDQLKEEITTQYIDFINYCNMNFGLTDSQAISLWWTQIRTKMEDDRSYGVKCIRFHGTTILKITKVFNDGIPGYDVNIIPLTVNAKIAVA